MFVVVWGSGTYMGRAPSSTSSQGIVDSQSHSSGRISELSLFPFFSRYHTQERSPLIVIMPTAAREDIPQG